MLEQIRALLHSFDRSASLHEINEVLLPRLESKVKIKGDYYDAMLGFLEAAAEEAGIEPFRIYTEEELIALLREHYDFDSKKYPEFVAKVMQSKRPIIGKVGRRGR